MAQVWSWRLQIAVRAQQWLGANHPPSAPPTFVPSSQRRQRRHGGRRGGGTTATGGGALESKLVLLAVLGSLFIALSAIFVYLITADDGGPADNTAFPAAGSQHRYRDTDDDAGSFLAARLNRGPAGVRLGRPCVSLLPRPAEAAPARPDDASAPPPAPPPPPQLSAASVRLRVILQFPCVVPLDPATEAAEDATDPLWARQDEYTYALSQTLLHPSVAKVHLLIDDGERDLPVLERAMGAICHEHALPPEVLEKLETHILGHRMTYGDAFAHANRAEAEAETPGQLATMIINSDIYPRGPGWFDLRARHFGPNNHTVMMLSRHTPACPRLVPSPPPPPVPAPVTPAAETGSVRARRPRLPNRQPRAIPCKRAAGLGSADAFVFRAPVPLSVVEELAEIPTHYWGAENRAAASLYRARFAPLLNPCEQLAIWHEHCSGLRTAGAGVPRVNKGKEMSKSGRWMARLPI